MHLRHLALTDFRSWPAAELALGPGPSVLVGANGQGKTNLVEAVEYVATLGSHRVATDAPLVRAGAERAVVRAAVVADSRELRIELEIAPGRANRAKLNGAPVTRTRDVLGALRTVVFAPEDLAVVRGDPGERRRFLDDLLVARAPRFAAVRSDYDRVLKQRAALLKSAGPRSGRRSAAPDEYVASTLDVWDAQLAAHGAELLHGRLRAVAALRPHTVAAYAQMAPSSAPVTLTYQSSLGEAFPGSATPASTPDPLDAEADLPAVEALEQALLAELARVRPSELERGVNLVGPHRDDLDLGIGALPVRGYASHGEGWTVALALRLGSYELLRADALPGGDPVLVLDDVFAELDTERRDQLALVAAKAEQALITAAVPSDVPDTLQAAVYTVQDGTVQRA